MDIGASELASLRVRNLEMVQSVIARLAGQGVTLKNYCVTLTTALCGLAIALQRPGAAFVALLPVFVIALLDAQYLKLERCFRAQFERTRTGDWSVRPDFDLRSHFPDVTYRAALRSWSIVLFYLPLAIGVAAVAVIARCAYGRFF